MDRSKPAKKTRLDQQFSDHEEEIRQIYSRQDKTLRETMDFFEKRRGLKASTRKWKAKLKDWGLDKYSKADEMAFIASKSQSRKSEGKDTTFFLGDKEITNETIERFMKRTHMNAEEILSPTAETPEKVSYSTPTSHDDTTIPIVFTIPPPTSEEEDWGGKFGFSSLEEFRSFVSSKPPLFPEQNTTIGSPGGETQLSERVQRGNPNSSKTYIFSLDQDRENSRETLEDPLLESDGTSDTQSSKQHTFFRSRHMVRGVGDGTIFQVIPESEAQLLKPEAVRSFLGLEDRSHDVAEQLTTAIGILNSPLGGPEQIDAQLDHPGRSDNLARDLKALERGNEPDDQRKEAPSEQDQEMEDLKSNPIGVTYTESCISGISWNYSPLFPKTTE